MRAPLSFVILCGRAQIHGWEKRCLAEAIDSGVAVLSGAVFTGDRRSRGSERDDLRPFYGMLERYSDALDPAEIDLSSGAVPVMEAESLDEADISRFVAAIAPHFLLVLGEADPALVRRLTALAIFGCWSYRFGAGSAALPHGAALEASRTGSPTVSAALVMTSGSERVLHDGSVRAFPAKPSKTLDELCFAIGPWLRRACFDLAHNGGAESRFPQAPPPAPPAGRSTVLSAIGLALGMMRGFVRIQAHYRLNRQQWNVGIVPAPIATVSGLDGQEAQAKALRQVSWMPEQPGRFFADPFGHEVSPGRITVLFELFDWPLDRGMIASRAYDGRSFGEVEVVLDLPTHLSYPFVVALDGKPHYVPEHSAGRDVSAYPIGENAPAPSRIPISPEVDFIDSTFVAWNGKVWLFALRERHTSNAELFLFHADAMHGPWQAHPLNPIKTDVGSARPGGTPFVHGGKLYRPSQDCSTHYGRATVINEITVLSDTEYAERSVARVEPPAGSRYPFGLHTVSQVGEMTLIDGARKVSKWFG